MGWTLSGIEKAIMNILSVFHNNSVPHVLSSSPQITTKFHIMNIPNVNTESDPLIIKKQLGIQGRQIQFI